MTYAAPALHTETVYQHKAEPYSGAFADRVTEKSQERSGDYRWQQRHQSGDESHRLAEMNFRVLEAAQPRSAVV